jgi:hypothetical protein
MSLKLWGHLLANKCVVIHTDNMSLISVINNQTSKETKVMQLVRELVLATLHHNILFQAEHVAGKSNVLADALSRLQIELFHRLHPTARTTPTPVPPLPSLPK